MRLILGCALLLAGCSADTSPANAALDNGAAGNGAEGEVAANATQAARPAGMDRTAFLAQCRREEWTSDEICDMRWGDAQRSMPLADGILAIAPAPETVAPTLAAARTAFPQARWGRPTERPGGLAGGVIPATDVSIGIYGRPQAVSAVEFGVFVDVGGETTAVSALRDSLNIRGARFATLGCATLGVAGVIDVMRVDIPGRAPFILRIVDETHGMSGYSYDAAIYFTDIMPDLAALRAGRWPGAPGPDENAVEAEAWRATCESE